MGFQKINQEKLELRIGETIRRLRKEAGYTSQETFAYDAEVPRALYGQYEKGKNMTLRSLKKILDFHELSFTEFFELVERK